MHQQRKTQQPRAAKKTAHVKPATEKALNKETPLAFEEPVFWQNAIDETADECYHAFTEIMMEIWLKEKRDDLEVIDESKLNSLNRIMMFLKERVEFMNKITAAIDADMISK